MLEFRKFNSVGGSQTHYARRPVAPYGTRGKPRNFRGTAEFTSKLDSAFSELWTHCPFGVAEVVTSAGAYVNKPGMHGKGRAFDLDGIFWKDRVFITKEFPNDQRLYLGIEAILHRHFGVVLSHSYNEKHRDHFHIDDGRSPTFRPSLSSQTLLIQNSCRTLLDINLAVDGIFGTETDQSAHELVRSCLGHDENDIEKVWPELLLAIAKRCFEAETEAPQDELTPTRLLHGVYHVIRDELGDNTARKPIEAALEAFTAHPAIEAVLAKAPPENKNLSTPQPPVKPSRRQYNQWSGVLIKGQEPFERPLEPILHMHRALWLTAQLEAPFWGTVQSYDGAAMSGGPLHSVAVLPRTMEQGSFFKLLERIKTATPTAELTEELVEAFANKGWSLRPDGCLYEKSNGRKVDATAIRAEFTPIDGRVPEEGTTEWKQAVKWATLFHHLLSAPETRLAQVEHAMSWLENSAKREERSVYATFSGFGDGLLGLKADSLTPEFELAMCVYHNFSANAPGTARRILKAVTEEQDEVEEFSKALVSALSVGRANWRRRYPRTRKAVLRGVSIGLWSNEVAQKILPE